MNGPAPQEATRRVLQGLYKREEGKVFIEKNRWGRRAINNRKERTIFRPGHLQGLWGGGKERTKVLIMRIAPFFYGSVVDAAGPPDRLLYWC